MKEVFGQNTLSILDQFNVLNQRIQQEFSGVKDELDEHLLAINENTRDIETQQNVLDVLDEKMEKLNMRVDTMQRMFRNFIMQTKVRIDLSINEQKLFIILYEFGKYVPLTYLLSKTLIESAELEDCLAALSDKGIPIERRTIGEKIYVKMDEDFRKLQASEPIVRVSQSVVQQMENKVLASFF
ncbi:hypothetical protein HYS47_01035 [Candidatus Woesearchaeota archaeon]|nr:hypothetical protein [Candidatus Woesearchaeota archaeon]